MSVPIPPSSASGAAAASDGSSRTGRALRVGMVLDQRFPPDARVEREALALIRAGFEVHLLCARAPGEAYGRDADEWTVDDEYQGIRLHRVDPEQVIYRVPLIGFPTRFPYRGLAKRAAQTFWNLDPVWFTLIRRFIRRYEIDILHIHDLRLASTGLAAASQADLPLVADLHEHYPALMAMLKGRQSPQRGARARRKWDRVERYVCREADRVLTVVEEARDRLLAKGVRAPKVSVIPNTVDIDKFLAVQPDSEVIRHYKNDFVLTYVGHLNSEHRGIQTALEAVATLKDQIHGLKFVAAGEYRPDYRKRLDHLIDRLDLHHCVDFTGWLDETAFASYIQAADICLIPHLANEHTDATFPNKAYLYHLYGKPIIAADCKPLVRYLAETQGGLTYRSGDARALADAVLTLHDDRSRRQRMGRSGQEAVFERHNWKATAERLVSVYRGLAQEWALGRA
ncbi:MAG: glycosyltransferase family 4 protein [Vampirovibrionales bacterium]|nr:glycosyltransferase family 4 protein [Vampirovibrionales bacterium]